MCCSAMGFCSVPHSRRIIRSMVITLDRQVHGPTKAEVSGWLLQLWRLKLKRQLMILNLKWTLQLRWLNLQLLKLLRGHNRARLTVVRRIKQRAWCKRSQIYHGWCTVGHGLASQHLQMFDLVLQRIVQCC